VVPNNFNTEIPLTTANTYTFTGGVDNLSAVYKVIKYEVDYGVFTRETSQSIRVENSILDAGDILANTVMTNQDGNAVTIHRYDWDGTDANVAFQTGGYGGYSPTINVGDTLTISPSGATGNVTSVLQGYSAVQGFSPSATANLTVSQENQDPDNTTIDSLIIGPGGSGGLGVAKYQPSNPPGTPAQSYSALGAGGGGGGGYISTTHNFTDFTLGANTEVVIGVGGISYVEDYSTSGTFESLEPIPPVNISTNIVTENGSKLLINGVANTSLRAGRGGSGATWSGQRDPVSGTNQRTGQTGSIRGSGGGAAAGSNHDGPANVSGSGGNVAGTSGGLAIFEADSASGNLYAFVSAGGGGGGFTSAGGNANIFSSGTGPYGLNLLQGGAGGAGITNTITGESVIYCAGGGGGGMIAGSGGGGVGGTGGSNANILSYPMGIPFITPFGFSSPVTNTAGAPHTGSGGGGAGALANISVLTASWDGDVPVGGLQPAFYPESPTPEASMNYPGAGASGTVILRWKYRYKKLSL